MTSDWPVVGCGGWPPVSTQWVPAVLVKVESGSSLVVARQTETLTLAPVPVSRKTRVASLLTVLETLAPYPATEQARAAVELA